MPLRITKYCAVPGLDSDATTSPKQVDLVAPPPASDHLAPSWLSLGSSHIRLHQTLSAFRLYVVPLSHRLVSRHSTFTTDLRIFRYAQFLHPYGCSGLLFPFRLASVLHHTGIASVLHHTGITSVLGHCGFSSDARRCGIA
ncbi:hypothetical protein DPX16_23391 [Anabarilius grahami]|uniref:Uncharacterized protein n=1 Tax=Anabarilius grahami TaxID=495550 RepID=A0A3N0Y1C4_ANAGA|nr:hypothetical protein DPX16_23391 [Anabarilius grahami]